MKPRNRVGALIWLSAMMALLSYASVWFFPRQTFGIFAWGFELIPLMEWLFPLLPMLPAMIPLALLLVPAVRRGGNVPWHATYPLIFLLACFVLLIGLYADIWFSLDED